MLTTRKRAIVRRDDGGDEKGSSLQQLVEAPHDVLEFVNPTPNRKSGPPHKEKRKHSSGRYLRDKWVPDPK